MLESEQQKKLKTLRKEVKTHMADLARIFNTGQRLKPQEYESVYTFRRVYRLEPLKPKSEMILEAKKNQEKNAIPRFASQIVPEISSSNQKNNRIGTPINSFKQFSAEVEGPQEYGSPESNMDPADRDLRSEAISSLRV